MRRGLHLILGREKKHPGVGISPFSRYVLVSLDKLILSISHLQSQDNSSNLSTTYIIVITGEVDGRLHSVKSFGEMDIECVDPLLLFRCPPM